MKTLLFSLLLFSSLLSKELICVVGGAQESHRKVKVVARALEDTLFDAVALRYRDRHGAKQSGARLLSEIRKLDISTYDKVHFFCFTLGGIVFAQVVDSLSVQPSRVVLVESPIENNISAIAQRVYPRWLLRVVSGKVVLEIPEYSGFSLDSTIETGLFITTGINSLARRVQARALRRFPTSGMREELLHPTGYYKNYRDFFYSSIDHSEIYSEPQQYREELLAFFRDGHFTEVADRSKCGEIFTFFPIVD